MRHSYPQKFRDYGATVVVVLRIVVTVVLDEGSVVDDAIVVEVRRSEATVVEVAGSGLAVLTVVGVSDGVVTRVVTGTCSSGGTTSRPASAAFCSETRLGRPVGALAMATTPSPSVPRSPGRIRS
jgi:hypothetical protein